MNKKEVEKLIYEYSETEKSIKDLEKEYGISSTIIYRYLNKYNIPKRKNIINESIIKNAIEDYKNNKLTADYCCKKYDIKRTTFSRYLKKYNIPKNITKTQHKYNKDYFEQIDDEFKAYWFGFLCADGCIKIRERTIELHLSLKESDHEHIEKFLKCLGYVDNIIQYRDVSCGFNDNKYKSCRITIACKKMCEDLIKYGMLPNKSLTFPFPKNIPDELLRHFLRGYFDGDGCITNKGIEKNTNYKYYHLSLIGSLDFCKNFDIYLNKVLNTTITKQRKQGKMYIWSKNGNIQIRKILDFLYKDSNIYLDRKNEIYLEFCRLNSNTTKELRL